MMLLDTGFLIDLQREWIEGEAGAAQRFIEGHLDEEFLISVVTQLEFLEGYAQTRDGEAFLEPFGKLEVTENVARLGSRIRRSLRKQGQLIGDFDVLIAATALDLGAGLVSANLCHFGRIPALQLVSYHPST